MLSLPFMVQMKPLFDDHFVDRFAIVVLLVTRPEAAPLRVLQFNDAVADAGGDDGHERQQQAAVDVGYLAAGEVVVAGQVIARRQRRCVQLHRLRAGIALAEEEHVRLDLALNKHSNSMSPLDHRSSYRSNSLVYVL